MGIVLTGGAMWVFCNVGIVLTAGAILMFCIEGIIPTLHNPINLINTNTLSDGNLMMAGKGRNM